MEWKKITDSLPPLDTNVILTDGEEVFCGNRELNYNKINCWSNQPCDGVCYGWYEKGEITHWMEMPKPPNA